MTPTTVIHPDRLLLLAALLEKDAAKPTGLKFDLGMWAAPADDTKRSWDRSDLGVTDTQMHDGVVTKLPEVSCGTMGCALGFAALSGEFAKYGLGMTYAVTFSGNIDLLPVCNDREGFDAGEELFGISYETSCYLFDPDCYDDTPRGAEGELEVAQRIRALVDGEIEDEYHPALNGNY